jgi:hypothetical protein
MAELILVAAMLNRLDYNVEIDVLWASTKSGIQWQTDSYGQDEDFGRSSVTKLNSIQGSQEFVRLGVLRPISATTQTSFAQNYDGS